MLLWPIRMASSVSMGRSPDESIVPAAAAAKKALELDDR